MEKTILVGIAIWSFFMQTPATLGANLLAPQTAAERIQSLPPFQFKWKSNVLAENEPQAVKTGDQKAKEKADQAPESGTTTTENSVDNSNNAERKPLKPFRPSEEIAAEQAVDFPVDI